MSKFDVLDTIDVLKGHATDAYFERTEDALMHSDTDPEVVAEITADQFSDGNYEIFAGLKDATHLLEGLAVDVEAIREGTMFSGGPVMRIRGRYTAFARYETALLGFLSHASGIASAAYEVSAAAGDVPVLSFGARHVNPFIGPMVERSALIGGMDGFSLVAAEKFVGKESSGTMPHALMLAHGRGNQEEAWTAFNEGVHPDVPRTVLVDTFTDEVDETRRAVETLGDDLDAVRLDTTGSRRGNFEHIIKEVRWTLRELGRDDVDIIVTGGLGPKDLRQLRGHVDGFGVGSYVACADPVDFSLDIVEREGEPITKRGKLGGVKDTPMKSVIEDGEIVCDFGDVL